jgi:hypothetical protein
MPVMSGMDRMMMSMLSVGRHPDMQRQPFDVPEFLGLALKVRQGTPQVIPVEELIDRVVGRRVFPGFRSANHVAQVR